MAAASAPGTTPPWSSSLVLFCASHVADESRLRMLRMMLRSWQEQSHPVELWLSISAATDHLKASVKEEVQQASWKRLHAFPRGRPYAQFEHLQFLTKRYADEHVDTRDTTWVCFSDDDDTFGPERMRAFKELIFKELSSPPAPGDVVPFVGIDAPNLSDSLPLTPAQEKLAREEGIVKRGCGAEYMQYCIQLPALHYFFERTSPDLWQHRYADLFFQRFLHRGNQEAVPAGWKPMMGSECVRTEYAYWERPGCEQARGQPELQPADGRHVIAYLRRATVGPAGFNREDYWRWLQGLYPLSWSTGVLGRDDALLETHLQVPAVQAMLRRPSFVHWRIERLQQCGHDDVAGKLQHEFDDYILRASRNTPATRAEV